MSAESSVPPAIPCLVMSHGLDEINIASLRSMLESEAPLVIDVVHNPWPAEDGSFEAFCLEAIRQGRVNSFTRLDENISNNAVHLALAIDRERYLQSPYMIVTDCDVTAPPDAVLEELAILERHPHLFACGLRIDASRWPDGLHVKQDLVARFNTAAYEREDHILSGTGIWMSMFRTAELYRVLDLLDANGIRFIDGNLKRMAMVAFNQGWAATKRSMGRELNRERTDYDNRKSVSMSGFGAHSPEPQGSRFATWNHNVTSGGVRTDRDGSSRLEAPRLVEAAARVRGPLDEDSLVQSLLATETPLEVRATPHTRPHRGGTRIQLVAAGTAPHSLTGLPDDGSILYISTTDGEGPALPVFKRIDVGGLLNEVENRYAKAWFNGLIRLLTDDGCLVGELADPTRNPESWSPHGFAKLAKSRGWALDLSVEGDSRRFSISRCVQPASP